MTSPSTPSPSLDSAASLEREHQARVPVPHKAHEDVQALLAGTLFVALGIVLFQHAGLLTGGTAGLAFLIHYATGWSFSLVFFTVNLPFYVLAWKRLGPVFALKTFVAVALLSVMAHWVPRWIEIGALNAAFASVLGGLLAGSGMLILFRHRASLGGFNVLVLFLQERFGWRAGTVQMLIDCTIVLAAFAVVEPMCVVWSVLGAVVVNLVLANNHRAGRYMAV